MMITSLSSYTKMMKMAMRWQKRQEEGDYTPDKTEFADNSFQNEVDEKKDSEMERSEQTELDIDIKLTAGKTLTPQEMQYLKIHNPAMYQEAKSIERDRKAYEKALESCTTKEEVEQLKTRHAEAAAKRVRSIWKNSAISPEKKRELLKMEHRRAAALDDAMHEFSDSIEYEFLPEGTKESTRHQEEEKERNDENRNSKEKEASGLDLDMEVNVFKFPARKEPSDDAGEEGSITKAILDEEARLAREDQENAAASQRKNGIREEESEEQKSSRIELAQKAYLSARPYSAYAGSSRIDMRK